MPWGHGPADRPLRPIQASSALVPNYGSPGLLPEAIVLSISASVSVTGVETVTQLDGIFLARPPDAGARP